MTLGPSCRTPELSGAGGPWLPNRQPPRPARVRSSDLVMRRSVTERYHTSSNSSATTLKEFPLAELISNVSKPPLGFLSDWAPSTS